MDRLESMNVLLKVVECGSLSAASRKLGVPLPTVSRKISELEAHLKTRLLNRSTRRLELTDAGRSYIQACKRILDEVEEAERAVTGEYSAPKGNLTITAPIVFGRTHILPVATEFLKAYPDIDIRMVLTDRSVNLMEEHIDLAVRVGELPDSSMVATRVGLIRLVVCGSPAYFSTHGMPKSPKELSNHDCVTFEHLMSPSEWMFPNGKSKISVGMHSRLIVSTAEAAVDAAIAGVGITRVLSYQIGHPLQAGKLGIILDEFEPPPSPVSLVYNGGRALPLKLRAFLDFAGPRLKAKLPQSTMTQNLDRAG